MNLTAVGILAVVFLLIMVRRVGKFRLPIWGIMTAGALAALLFQTISISSAISAVQLDVIAFLFGMFVFGAALDKSGLLRMHQLLQRKISPYFQSELLCPPAVLLWTDRITV